MDPAATVQRYYEAFNARDWGAYPDLFTPDAELLVPDSPDREPAVVGPDGMARFDRIWTGGFPDGKIRQLAATSDGVAQVMSENRLTGHHTGALDVPGGTIAPTGRVFDAPYVATFVVRDARIASQHLYYDRMAVAEILGLAEVSPV